LKKRAVITILGIQGGWVDNGKVSFSNINNLAIYYFEGSDNKREYFNTLPLLVERYKDEYEIIPLFTEESKIFNQEVLNRLYPDMRVNFDDKYLIRDEKSFKEVFSLFNRTIEEFDEVIIDVTHGFRHLPLLMLIDLMIINFRDINRVKKILFAKEIVKHIPKSEKQGIYEIIDLKDYLDLANLSFMLSTFNQNYTVSNHIKTNNSDYNSFIEELSNFSKHILANSISALIVSTKNQDSISYKIIKHIDKILSKDDDILKNFEPFLLKIKRHIEEIKGYGKLKDYEMFYNLSKNMLNKGYLLNSITLLSEAIGLYTKELFKEIDTDIKEFIEEFEEKLKKHKNSSRKYNLYKLSNQSKNLYKLGIKFRGNYLEIEKPNNNQKKFNKRAEEVTSKIKNHILTLQNGEDKDYIHISDLIDKINSLRNNLAHGNSSKRLDKVGREIENVLNEFRKFI
jgi:CRISPR-associated DxTHG motif protein